MENQIPYKRMPDGSPSYLSLNDLRVFGLPRQLPFNGLLGKQIYTSQIIWDILRDALSPHFLDLTPTNVISALNRLLKINAYSNQMDSLNRQMAQRILAVPAALHLADTKTCAENPGFMANDKEFWRHCRDVRCYGSLADGMLGASIQRHIDSILCAIPIRDFHVHMVSCDVTASLLGLSHRLDGANEGIRLLFDFGHTNIKRGLSIRAQNENAVVELSSIPTPAIPTEDHSIRLHEMIVNIILRSYNETLDARGCCRPEAMIAIANNVWHGRIAHRGYYGTLATLGNTDYVCYVSDELSNRTGAHWKVKMFNDADAIALMVEQPSSVVISLGTNMGIGYPRIGGTV